MKNITEQMELIEEKIKILKALSHPIRLCIVKGLIIEEGCNVSTMQDCLDIPQSTLSQHLIKLKDLGILKGVRDGLNINYYVINEDARKIIKALF
ncbi:MAG: ArsR/SmtB family transcription factor [Halanaerobiales bacterium]